MKASRRNAFCAQLMQKVLRAVVLLRKKRVLSAPFQQRFRGDLPDVAKDLLSEAT
jgi:hypothetical protein